MNQARKRTGTKKVLSMILVLVMLLSLLSMAAFTLPTAASSDSAASNDDSFYRIVHLDCGREYFTKDWIIALINEMSAAGYNQLQLAFGNGGFRFYLNDMGVGSYGSDAVKNALEDGNNHYNTYGDDGKGTANGEWITYSPEKNALTEQEMDAIIVHAKSKGVEIVPMLNTPGHMHALLAAMQELGMSNVSVSGKTGCMNLDNSNAVDFTKALLTKYVNYFANKGCKFFNLATDEYSSFNTTFYNYANSLVDIVTAAKMTPRVFNDSFLSSGNNNIKSNNTYPTQVCYWYQGSTKSASSLSNSGYPMINTNHDYYYVSTNEYWNLYKEGYTFVGDYNENTWVNKAAQFSNTRFYGSYGSNVSSPAGSMFCIWCNTPGKNNETAIAQQIRMILRVIGARMQNSYDYSASSVLVDGGFKADGTINKPSETQEDFKLTLPGADGAQAPTLTVNGTTTLTATTEATWTSSNENVVKLSAAQTADAAKAAAVSTAITGTAVTATAVGAGTATITATSTADSSKTAQITLTVAAGDSALSKVTLPINLWLTNTGVVPTGWATTYNSNSISKPEFSYETDSKNTSDNWRTFRAKYNLSAAESNVHSEQGAKLSNLLPGTGTAYGYRGASTPESYAVDFWKCSYNTSAERQSTDGWTNNSNKGTVFEYIRYWQDKWEYSSDGSTWTEIKNVGAGKDDTAKNQVCIWYRQKTAITDEVTTEIVDWGPIKYDAGQCLLDFAVKYESGDKTPTSFPVTNKTIGFDCPTSQDAAKNNGYVTQDGDGYYYRTVYGIAGVETSNYEVYMITVTPSADNHGTTINSGYYAAKSYPYAGTEKVAWAKTKADADNSNLTKTDDITYGGEAFLKKVDIYQYQGLLITYYVRDKSANLTVHYVDLSDGNEFHSYGITTNGQTFNSNIRLNSTDWKGPLLDGTVTNIKGKKQTVSADLSDMPSISAKYRYATGYTCVRVETKNDCKDVYLYYTFNNKVNYVIDFGLPLEIKLTDLSAELGNANITNVSFFSAQYGTLVYDSDRKVITYKLNGMLSEQESFTVEVEGTRAGQKNTVAYIVTIIPASTVYYEDDFISFKNNGGEWKREGDTVTNAVQDLDALTAKKTYGYDSNYSASSRFSLGSAMKTTVSSDTNSNPPKATFTFKGTGFDLVSMTSKDTGTILVNVVGKDSEGNSVTKNWIVDTFYGYTRTQEGYIQYTWTKGEDGKWHNKAVVIPELPQGKDVGGTPEDGVTYEPNYIWTPTGEVDNALYQIPVIHYTDLPYGEYTVTVTPKYSSKRDPYYQADGNNNSYDFYLDGVRVYNPAGDKLNSQYVKDGEGYAQFTEIRNMLLNASDLTANIEPTTGMVFVDGVGDNGKLADFKNYGPNNEVYLARNQAIAFKISDMNNVASIQIGAKAPNGNATMQIKVGSNEVQTKELQTASDMYYKLDNVQADQTIVITNTSDSLLSLTTLKVTYKTEPSASNSADPVVDEEVVAQAPVMLMSMLYGEPQTFEPEHFTAKWSRNVRKGGTATLTVKASADVESITVNGETITAHTTKTARSFWGSKETYHVFTYRVTNAATADYSICAVNGDGVASDPITAKLTVRPSIRDWWNGIFDKWKH